MSWLELPMSYVRCKIKHGTMTTTTPKGFAVILHFVFIVDIIH